MTDENARITQATYDEVAEAFLERTRDPERSSVWLDHFAGRVAPGSVVADLGGGPGRDCGQLRARGLRAFCLDRSRGMLRAGRSEFEGERVQGDLRMLPLATESLAGAWANASLLHLEQTDFVVALAEIRRVLEPGGALHLTLKRGEGAGFERKRYGRPRWFQYWGAQELDAVLGRGGFRILESVTEERPSDAWLVRECAAGASVS